MIGSNIRSFFFLTADLIELEIKEGPFICIWLCLFILLYLLFLPPSFLFPLQIVIDKTGSFALRSLLQPGFYASYPCGVLFLKKDVPLSFGFPVNWSLDLEFLSDSDLSLGQEYFMGN